MSQYFYVVSHLNGFVLDISESKKGGNVINYPQNGGDNQLWKWEDGRLVSKLGLVLDIKDINTDSGAHCIGWPSIEPGLNQKWKLELQQGITIKSDLNGLVIDVEGCSPKAGTPIIMYHQKGEGVQNQKWSFVPEGAWNEFKFVIDQ